MCTLSWIVRGTCYELAFNRDESIARARALPPGIERRRGVEVLAPRDPEGGGTWLASNAYGTTLCLLNNYRSSATGTPQADWLSRGQLVWDLAVERASHEVLRALDGWPIERLRPFSLAVFEPGRAPMLVRWNGRQLQQQLGIDPPLTSSSYRPEAVERARAVAYRRLAARYRGRPLETQDLMTFHRSRSPLFPRASVAMRRPGRSTVSLTYVRVTADRVTMDYHDGFPAARPAPRCYRERLKRAPVIPAAAPEKVPRTSPPRTFDLRAILREKNPRLYESLSTPTFLATRRLVGEHLANRALRQLGSVSPFEFPEACLRQVGVTVRWVAERLPKEIDPPIYVANHPLGGLDGLALMAFILRRHGSMAAPVNDVLCLIPQLAYYCVPLDRENGKRRMASDLNAAFASSQPLLLFPAGRTSRLVDGRLRDHPWSQMVARLARRHRRPIIPVFVGGRNSRLFYTVAALRKVFRISTNLEMLLLVREFLTPRCRVVDLHVSAPISVEQLQRSGTRDAERAEWLRGYCQLLGERGLRGHGRVNLVEPLTGSTISTEGA